MRCKRCFAGGALSEKGDFAIRTRELTATEKEQGKEALDTNVALKSWFCRIMERFFCHSNTQ